MWSWLRHLPTKEPATAAPVPSSGRQRPEPVTPCVRCGPRGGGGGALDGAPLPVAATPATPAEHQTVLTTFGQFIFKTCSEPTGQGRSLQPRAQAALASPSEPGGDLCLFSCQESRGQGTQSRVECSPEGEGAPRPGSRALAPHCLVQPPGRAPHNRGSAAWPPLPSRAQQTGRQTPGPGGAGSSAGRRRRTGTSSPPAALASPALPVGYLETSGVWHKFPETKKIVQSYNVSPGQSLKGRTRA